jgi:enoyl-CoA hydratase
VPGFCFGGATGSLVISCRANRSASITARTHRTLLHCLCRLVALIGPARTKDLIFTARLIEAPEALALGLLNEVALDMETLQRRANGTAKLVAGRTALYQGAGRR